MNAIEDETETPDTTPSRDDTIDRQESARASTNERGDERSDDDRAISVADDELIELQVDGLDAGESGSGALHVSISADASPVETEKLTRKKLEEQLEALKRKEVELRRALVMADHPELADSIRILQGRTYALERAEAKLSLGLSKAELRRRETLQKKLASLVEKRAEVDTAIGEVQVELDGLGVERQTGYEQERKQALEELLVALGTHDPSLHAAGIEATELVPEISRWLPEIELLAESLASHKTQTN